MGNGAHVASVWKDRTVWFYTLHSENIFTCACLAQKTLHHHETHHEPIALHSTIKTLQTWKALKSLQVHT